MILLNSALHFEEEETINRGTLWASGFSRLERDAPRVSFGAAAVAFEAVFHLIADSGPVLEREEIAVRILVVDDDPNVCEVVKLYLEKQNAEVITMINGTEALQYFHDSGADFVILDLMMPGMDGLTMCREIRKGSTVPIIMLTAKAGEYDRIVGLDLGADDYVTKPFSPSELVSRVNSLIRRIDFDKNRYKYQQFEFPGLVIDPASRSVFVNGENVKVSPKEFDLLHLLAREPGRVFSRDTILNVIWGYDRYVNDRTVDVHIKWLRGKLSQNGNEYTYIRTVHKIGYKFEVRPLCK